MGINGLALATSIAITIQTIVLYIILKKKLKKIGTKATFVTVLKSVISATIMAFVTYFSYEVFNPIMPGPVATLLAILISCIVYFGIALLLKTEPIINLIHKLFRKKRSSTGD
jgi:putative peptidoglycan lipid II flippase